jgi:hypothetical protein
MFREESEMNGKEELNQKDGDKSQISYSQTKKTDIVEMYNFIKNNKEMDWEKFQKWLKDNGFNQTGHMFNRFSDGDIWHHEAFENLEWYIDIQYLEKKDGAIKFLNVYITKRR